MKADCTWSSLDYAPLKRASARGHKEMVKALLEADAHSDYKDYYGSQQALLEAVKHGHHFCAELLLQHKVILDKFDRSIALHCAEKRDDKAMTDLLLKYCPDSEENWSFPDKKDGSLDAMSYIKDTMRLDNYK